jgi:hypothetical protein
MVEAEKALGGDTNDMARAATQRAKRVLTIGKL